MHVLIKSFVTKSHGWTLAVYHGCSLEKISFPLETNQNCGSEDGWCSHLSSEAEIGVLLLLMEFASLEMSPFAVITITMQYKAWPLKVAHDNNNKHIYTITFCLHSLIQFPIL